jgi:hypothetical protein
MRRCSDGTRHACPAERREAPNQGGYWIVYRGDGANIAAGAALHVHVDPVRGSQCTE